MKPLYVLWIKTKREHADPVIQPVYHKTLHAAKADMHKRQINLTCLGLESSITLEKLYYGKPISKISTDEERL